MFRVFYVHTYIPSSNREFLEAPGEGARLADQPTIADACRTKRITHRINPRTWYQLRRSRTQHNCINTMSAILTKLTNPATYATIWANTARRAQVYYHPNVKDNG
jgi:hypothetical protein